MTDLSPQQLCGREAQGQISHSDILFSEFMSLDPRLQETLFGKLQTENARLREVDKGWDRFKRLRPHIDTQIYLSSARIESPDGQDDRNGYNQQEAFFDKWTYITKDDNDVKNRSEEYAETVTARWNVSNLVSESPESDLEFCTHDPSIQCSYSSKRPIHFGDRISSQLLLYRLTVTFGMAPPSNELCGYKSCWEVDLKHCDGGSVLRLQDYKGAADVSFDGTTIASADALELLNFLIGMNCPHTYDGVVAGTIA